ncbi:hypothetical protein FKW77_007260 [Venturia effusa]|uniref:Uncharacterized protein n=1 Tax=Venturia effusa TaxID=50376 RepID=A0A517LE43_9PEZI|nr:hypothetical protein FKW77_007260 [Venturia effusa]
MAPPTSGDYFSRPRRQPPVARQNSTGPELRLNDESSPLPPYKEPVRGWTTLPYPFKNRIPHPSETGYTVQPSAVQQINQIDNEWSSLQQHGFLDTLHARGEETHLEPVRVQTLSQFGQDLQRRKEKMAEFNSLPLEQQVPSADKLPENMTPQQYLALLQQDRQRGILDEQLYRSMEGQSPLPPLEDMLPQPSEEQLAQLLVEGTELLPEGLAYPQMHDTATSFMQSSDRTYAPLPPGGDNFSSCLPLGPSGQNLDNAYMYHSETGQTLTVPSALLQSSNTSAAQAPSARTQIGNYSERQISGHANQERFGPSMPIMPHQTMGTEMRTAHDHQASKGNIALPDNILHQHHNIDQQAQHQQVSYLIQQVCKGQPSIDVFVSSLRARHVPPSISNLVWNHPALASWRSQKLVEHRIHLQEVAGTVHQENFSYIDLLRIAEEKKWTAYWMNEVRTYATGLGWNLQQKVAEARRQAQMLVQEIVSKNVSYSRLSQYARENKLPRAYIIFLTKELGRRGWNMQQKEAESLEQQRLMFDPTYAAQNQSTMPVQQLQMQQRSSNQHQQSAAMMRSMSTSMRNPDQIPNQMQSTYQSQAMLPPQQMQSPFPNQMMSPPQQQGQRSMTPAGLNGSSPYQQPLAHVQYNQETLHQHQAQRMRFMPTPSPVRSSSQLSGMQTQMQDASHQGQSAQFCPGPATASPRISARTDTASPRQVTGTGKTDGHSQSPETKEMAELSRQRSPRSGNKSTRNRKANPDQGTLHEQAQAKNTVSTVRVAKKRPAEEPAEPETSRVKQRGTRE